MDHMIVKAFIFDLGKVIVELDFTQFIDDIISQSPLFKAKAKDLLEDFWNEVSHYDLGYISEKEFYSLSREFLKVKQISQERFISAFNSVISKTNQELINCIQKLKNENRYRIVMLSNVNPTHWKYGKKNKWNFLHLFDDILLSYELHMVKPDLKIFKQAIKICSCDPEEIVYTDDRLDNIQAARDLGIHSIHYSNMNQWIKSLRTIDIII